VAKFPVLASIILFYYLWFWISQNINFRGWPILKYFADRGLLNFSRIWPKSAKVCTFKVIVIYKCNKIWKKSIWSRCYRIWIQRGRTYSNVRNFRESLGSRNFYISREFIHPFLNRFSSTVLIFCKRTRKEKNTRKKPIFLHLTSCICDMKQTMKFWKTFAKFFLAGI